MDTTSSDKAAVSDAAQVVDKSDFRLIVLDDDNYITWKWQMEMILKTKGLHECIKGNCMDENKNRHAATVLASALSQLNMQRVINCNTAEEIWSTLESIFENKSATERSMLLEKFTSFKVRSIRDISKDIGELQALAAKLKSLGAKVEEEFIVSILLKALPDSLRTWKSTWMMINATNPKLNNLITGLMAEISCMRIPENSAMMATGKPWSKRSNSNRFNNQSKFQGPPPRSKTDTCNYCKKVGHWARDCRKRQYDEKNAGNTEGVAMMAMEASGDLSTKENWIADSGSSFHMTPIFEWIQDYVPFKEDKQIILGDNHRIPAKGAGVIMTSFGSLNDVHYVPGLSADLFSIAAAENKGIESRCDRD